MCRGTGRSSAALDSRVPGRGGNEGRRLVMGGGRRRVRGRVGGIQPPDIRKHDRVARLDAFDVDMLVPVLGHYLIYHGFIEGNDARSLRSRRDDFDLLVAGCISEKQPTFQGDSLVVIFRSFRFWNQRHVGGATCKMGGFTIWKSESNLTDAFSIRRYFLRKAHKPHEVSRVFDFFLQVFLVALIDHTHHTKNFAEDLVRDVNARHVHVLCGRSESQSNRIASSSP